MESIDKLREELEVCGCDPDECLGCEVPRKILEGLTEIEREIEQKFCKKPLDADGVPIDVGDKLSHESREFLVNGVVFYHNSWCVITDMVCLDDGFTMRYASECRHVKPDPYKELLEEFAEIVRMEQVEKAQVSESTLADFANKARELGKAGA